MEKKKYSCDTGSVAVKCGNNIVKFENGYGDGDFEVFIFESDAEFEAYTNERVENHREKKRDYHFFSSCEFREANILDYDCRVLDYIREEDYLFTITGKYFVYYNNGDVYFVNND